MKKFYAIPWIIYFLFFSNITMHSQTSITGKVTDKETGEDMIAADVLISKNGVFIQGTTTNIDGIYNFKVDAGKYDMEVSYTGYPTTKVSEIIVLKGETIIKDVELSLAVFFEECCISWGYKVPLIKQDETSTGITIEAEKIRKLPTRNINEIPMITPGISIRQ